MVNSEKKNIQVTFNVTLYKVFALGHFQPQPLGSLPDDAPVLTLSSGS